MEIEQRTAVLTAMVTAALALGGCASVKVQKLDADGKVAYKEIVAEVTEQPDYSAAMAALRMLPPASGKRSATLPYSTNWPWAPLS